MVSSIYNIRYIEYVLVVLCLHKVELLLDPIAALENGEFERLIGLLWWTLFCVLGGW